MALAHQNEVNQSMDKLCDHILNFDGVRFAGLISDQGKLYSGGFKEGIRPYECNEKRQAMYMRFALESCFRNDFDDSLGDLQYTVSQRKNVSIITMNVCSYVLLVFAEPNIDILDLVKRIKNLLVLNEV